jgi:hypothetical protein
MPCGPILHSDRIARSARRGSHESCEPSVVLRTGTPTSDAKIDVLTGLVRQAAANSGNVTDAIWNAEIVARKNTDQELAAVLVSFRKGVLANRLRIRGTLNFHGSTVRTRADSTI